MKNKIVPHFYVKESRKDNNGEAPIYLRITVNGERAEISANRRIKPEMWDKASERVAGRGEPARVINSSLNNILGKVEKYFSGFDDMETIIKIDQKTLTLELANAIASFNIEKVAELLSENGEYRTPKNKEEIINSNKEEFIKWLNNCFDEYLSANKDRTKLN